MDQPVVDRLVEGYQATLQAASNRLADGAERRILVAAVVENAQAARRQLVASTPGGDRLVARLDAFLAEAQKMDIVGQLFAQARSYATGAAKAAIDWAWKAALGLAAPPAIPAICGAVLGFSGALQDVGRELGAVIGVIIAGAFVIFARYPHLIFRSVQLGAGSAVEAWGWSQQTFGRAVSTVDDLGRHASRLLEENLAAPARQFFVSQSNLPGWGVPARTRNAAKGVLYGTVALIVACLIPIGYGLSQGLEESNDQPSPFTPPTICLTPADGNCF